MALVVTERGGPKKEDYFQVIPANGECPQGGAPVYYGQTIRLKHIASGYHVHSHLNHKLPGSKQQEVVIFHETDDNDNWVVEKFGGADNGVWKASQGTILRHLNTGKRLHSHPIPVTKEQFEVTAYDGDLEDNDCWRVLF